MVIAQFCGTILEEADQRPVDIAETKKAEVVAADIASPGTKAHSQF